MDIQNTPSGVMETDIVSNSKQQIFFIRYLEYSMKICSYVANMHILSVIGTGVLTVFIVLTISFCADNGKDYESPALVNTNWREQKTYSQDYQLNEETSICVSMLDDLSGYAVYNTENGERIGTLACPNYQIGAGEQELKIADVNGDKSNDIGVIMQNSTVIWYKYSPNKEYSKDNPNGRFEAIG